VGAHAHRFAADCVTAAAPADGRPPAAARCARKPDTGRDPSLSAVSCALLRPRSPPPPGPPHLQLQAKRAIHRVWRAAARPWLHRERGAHRGGHAGPKRRPHL
jgi:hypothetical protein